MDTTVSYQEAAKQLGVNVKTVYRMVRDGLVRPVYQDGQDRLRADELAAVLELRYQNLTVAEIAALAKTATARVMTLERQLNRLNEFLGLDIPALSCNPDDVVARYAEVEVLLGTELLPLSDVQFIVRWSRRFYAMGHEQFQLIADHTADPEPWAKILKLATRMFMEQPRHQDPDLEQAYRHLLVGRRFMRQAAYFYVRARHGYHVSNRLFREIQGGFDHAILSTAFPSE